MNDKIAPKLSKRKQLFQLIGIFIKIGAINFGGPMATIAIMEQEFVRKRKWLSQEHFLDLMAATNLVPGPNACEMAAHIGFTRAKWVGLVLAEMFFILPAAVLSTILAIIYVKFGALPQVASLFYSINPIIVSLIIMAIWRLGKPTLNNFVQGIIFTLALLGTLAFHLNEVLVIFGGGVLAILLQFLPAESKKIYLLSLFFPIFPQGISLHTLTQNAQDNLAKIFLFFLKTGSLIFGSGMVLFAFIQTDIVDRYGWLTQKQLIDAIAVGQMTPGPVMSSAAFIGYLLAGWKGALVSTLGIFLPSFFIVAAIGPFIPRMRESKVLQAFLRGVNAAVLALMISICLTIFKNAITDVWTFLIMAVAFILLLRFKLDSIWLILAGVLLGLLRLLI